ncbi:hypothetical protein [Rhodococcus spongiicola]|uniref:Ig-like domain-containing protein n=1 Tax=Rhodococcus spongiicola TaxID=2487352 RepID=A0A3S3AE15_9NOCA|nr:hypothetical protein [Rhodococcus spongiicola]RVW02382.1 hypothetical protein EF834_12355 [Rhodococcus spongiicola]RVW02383.1 hypothetical protein EF834_12360 [Rhodococcus spongiicola]
MKKSIRTGAVALLAAPLVATAFAAPAQAAGTGSLGSSDSSSQEAVSFSVAVEGNDVTASIVNNTDGELGLGCSIWYVLDEEGAERELLARPIVAPGDTFTSDPETIDEAGTYVATWTCYSADTDERWGTEESDGVDATAEPVKFTVPNDDTSGSVGSSEGGEGSLADNPALLVGSVAIGGLAIGGLILSGLLG